MPDGGRGAVCGLALKRDAGMVGEGGTHVGGAQRRVVVREAAVVSARPAPLPDNLGARVGVDGAARFVRRQVMLAEQNEPLVRMLTWHKRPRLPLCYGALLRAAAARP